MTTVTTQLTIPAEDIKPRDLLVWLGQEKVESVSHLGEFYVTVRFADLRPFQIAKVQYVTVIREVRR